MIAVSGGKQEPECTFPPQTAIMGSGRVDDERVGALVTLGPPAGSSEPDLPWIVTFAPLGDGAEWEPVVFGPYERPHALGLAEAVVADEDLMAVVEPLLPYASLAEIRAAIAAAQVVAVDVSGIEEYDEHDQYGTDEEVLAAVPEQIGEPPTPQEVRTGFARIAALLTQT
jgi:hypothetical protein